MNIKQFAFDYMYQNGMDVSDAETVVEEMQKDEFFSKSIKWSDDLGDYPGVFRATLMLSVKSFALKWIDAHMPQAWYREMFV